MGILRDMPRLFQSSILLKVCAPVPKHVCVLQFFAKVFEFLRNLGLLGKPSSNARIRERASFQLGWYMQQEKHFANSFTLYPISYPPTTIPHTS